VAGDSLFEQVKQLERQIGGILSAYDIAELPQLQRDLATALKNQLIDARLSVRDYEYAGTRVEQLAAAKEAKDFFKGVQETIVKVSQFGLFGTVDVAQLTARIDLISSQLA
jgi:hypothetical protein